MTVGCGMISTSPVVEKGNKRQCAQRRRVRKRRSCTSGRTRPQLAVAQHTRQFHMHRSQRQRCRPHDGSATTTACTCMMRWTESTLACPLNPSSTRAPFQQHGGRKEWRRKRRAMRRRPLRRSDVRVHTQHRLTAARNTRRRRASTALPIATQHTTHRTTGQSSGKGRRGG